MMGNKFVKLVGLVMLLSSLSSVTQANAGEVGAYTQKGETTFIGDPYEFPTEPEDPEEPKEPGKPPVVPPKRPSYPGSSGNGGSTGGSKGGSTWTNRAPSGSVNYPNSSGKIIPRTGDQPRYIAVIQGSLILSLMGIMIINLKKIR